MEKEKLRIPTLRNQAKVILSNSKGILNVEKTVMSEMKDRFMNSPFNDINHYKISLDNYK